MEEKIVSSHSSTESDRLEITEQFREWQREAMRNLTAHDGDVHMHAKTSGYIAPPASHYAPIQTPQRSGLSSVLAAGAERDVPRNEELIAASRAAALDGDVIELGEFVDQMYGKTAHQRRVEQFMEAGGHTVPGHPTEPSRECRLLRAKLILEEALETIQALGFEVVPNGDADHVHKNGVTYQERYPFDIVEVADGCADISVVTIGTLSACGIADDALLREVDRSNMAKFEGGVKHDQYGKIQKPAGWKPPDIRTVLNNQGWNDGKCG